MGNLHLCKNNGEGRSKREEKQYREMGRHREERD